MKFSMGIYNTILENDIESQPTIINGPLCYIYVGWQQASIVQNKNYLT